MLNLRKKSPVLEIARLAGVSKAAAYATLNPETSGNIGVGEEKRRRILEAAATVGYVRNELASSLVTGRTNTIGVCVQSLRNHFFGNFLNMLDSLAYPEGYSVMISSSEFDSERELRNVRNFIAKRVDAIAIACSDFERLRDSLKDFRSEGTKFVILGEDFSEGVPSISFDEMEIGRIQANRLWTSGRRKVAHLNASASTDLAVRLHSLRLSKFSCAWRDLSGLSPLNFPVSNVFFPEPDVVFDLASKIKTGEIDAVACSADTLAMGLISALASMDLKVPENLSVIGIDDLDYSSGFFVPLTTVRLPTDKLALNLWNIMKRLLEGDQFAGHIVVQPELVIRKSA